jgi:activating signal cointegrator complex subunit 1
LHIQSCFVSRQLVDNNDQLDDDDTIDYIVKDKMFVCQMDIATAFYGLLIGKSAETKLKLERESKTQIIFPRHDEIGMVQIRGRTKASVQSARTRIELMIDRNRQIQPMTHFISLPICQSTSALSIKEKYDEFQRNVLEQCSDERGVNRDLFQQATRLHLTISTFTLLSQSEVDFIQDVLNESVGALLREFMSTDDERFRVQLKGLKFMNDDPSFVDVLYAKVQLVNNKHSNRLQNFLDRLNENLSGTGLMKQKFDRLKLHVTLMNSLLRKDETGILEAQKTNRGRVKNPERESFDATKILKLFGEYDFGQVELNELHLSIMHQPDRQTGYYGCQTKISLMPSNVVTNK